MNHCIVFFFTAFSTLLANPVPETSFDPLLFIPVKPSFDQTSPLDFLVQSQLSSNSVQPNPVGFFTQNEPDATSVQTYPVNPGQAGQVDSFQISTALDANQKAQVNPGDALSPDSYPEYDDSTDTYDKKEQKRKKTNLPSLPLLPVLEKVRNCPSGSASACCFGSGTKHTVQPDDALGILDALTTTYYDWLFGCVKQLDIPCPYLEKKWCCMVLWEPGQKFTIPDGVSIDLALANTYNIFYTGHVCVRAGFLGS